MLNFRVFAFVCIFSLTLSTGCVSTYEDDAGSYRQISAAEDRRGSIGYRNEQVSGNEYWIKSRAVGVLQAEAFALKHAAELALADGYTYFSAHPHQNPLWTARFDNQPPYVNYQKQPPRYYERPEIEVEITVTLYRGDLPNRLGVYDAEAVAKHLKLE